MFISEKRFIDKFSFYERNIESTKIIKRYPDRVPVICEKNSRDFGIPDINKHKYLVPYNLTIGQFIYVIRKQIRLPASSALFLFVGEDAILLPISSKMNDIYHQYKNKDGFLYIMYSRENVFG